MVVGENLACVHRWASRRLSWIDHCLNPARTRGPPYRSAERDRTRTNPFLHSSWATRSSASQPRRWPAEPPGRTAEVRASA